MTRDRHWSRINSGSTVKDVAEYLGVPVPEIIKKLMGMGEMATLTQTLSDEAIGVLAEEFDKKIEIVHGVATTPTIESSTTTRTTDLVERPPVVTIMGHVDHGKTSLLDAIRETEVAAGEAGGITQHIGAYQVHHNGKTITFLDTPGHEAFTAMRARGASVTDIAVIVVAADDGVKPQTDEAIDHAHAADVPILVAVNKIDKEGADPTRVRTELTQRDLQPAEWGGETEYVDVSAKTQPGPRGPARHDPRRRRARGAQGQPRAPTPRGVVIESKLDPGRGPVVTMLDPARHAARRRRARRPAPHWGKVRAMVDYKGDRVKEAVPGDPVEVLGFDGVPDAGEFVRVVENDRTARALAAERADRVQDRDAGPPLRPQGLLRGRLQARPGAASSRSSTSSSRPTWPARWRRFEDEIAKLPQDEVAVNVIHSGVGGINESDVMLAAASDAVILGFNVRPVGDARAVADREGVEIRTYSVIYQALDDLRAAMEGMLEPEEVEETARHASRSARRSAPRASARSPAPTSPRASIRRGAKVRLVRDGTVVYDGDDRVAAPLQRRRARGRRRLRVRHRAAQLPGRQGRRRPGGLRDAAGRARARRETRDERLRRAAARPPALPARPGA